MLFIRPLLGLLQGIIFYALITLYPYGSPGAAAAVFIFTFPLFALQIKLPDKKTFFKNLMILGVMTLIYGLVIYQLLTSLQQNDAGLASTLIAQSSISLFIFFIFYCVLVEEGRFSFPYPALFSESWLVILKIFLGQIFVFLTWGLCWLAAMLFELLNISVVSDVVSSTPFFYIMTSFFFGTAMAILHQYESLITKLRNILLAFCKFLYPLLVVISFSFLLVVPFANKPFIDVWPIIILLSTLNLILFNGLYQRGLIQPPYTQWFRVLIYGVIFLNLLYSLYILKYPWQVIERFDVYSSDILLLINLILLAVYNFGYTLAVFFSRKPWLDLIKRVNLFLALIVATVYLMLALFYH